MVPLVTSCQPGNFRSKSLGAYQAPSESLVSPDFGGARAQTRFLVVIKQKMRRRPHYRKGIAERTAQRGPQSSENTPRLRGTNSGPSIEFKQRATHEPIDADLGKGRIVKTPLVKGRIVGLLVLHRRGFLSTTQTIATRTSLSKYGCVSLGSNAHALQAECN